MRNILVDTDGTWDNTSLLADNEPLEALRLRVHLKVDRTNDFTGKARVNNVSCTHFLMSPEGEYQPIFPGSVEVSVNGKGFVITNDNLAIHQAPGDIEIYREEEFDLFGDIEVTETIVEHTGESVVDLNPDTFTVSYDNVMSSLDDPIIQWCNRNNFYGSNLMEVLSEAIIDFNYPEDHWVVSLSLYKDNRFKADEIETVLLGASPSHRL